MTVTQTHQSIHAYVITNRDQPARRYPPYAEVAAGLTRDLVPEQRVW
jgi:hypothetical protein